MRKPGLLPASRAFFVDFLFHLVYRDDYATRAYHRSDMSMGVTYHRVGEGEEPYVRQSVRFMRHK